MSYKEFEREERYIVVKIKDIGNDRLEQKLRHMIEHECGAKLRDCVVVEHDWPNYEHVWETVRQVATGEWPAFENARRGGDTNSLKVSVNSLIESARCMGVASANSDFDVVGFWDAKIAIYRDEIYRAFTQPPAPKGWDDKAYKQMADEVEYWKARAAEASEALERIHYQESPTHMGEPFLPDTKSAPAVHDEVFRLAHTERYQWMLDAADFVMRDGLGLENLHDALASGDLPMPGGRATIVVSDEAKDRLRDAIAEALGDSAYDCTRVWSAWGVNTMGPDDFDLIVGDGDRLEEIVDAALSTLIAAPEADQ